MLDGGSYHNREVTTLVCYPLISPLCPHRSYLSRGVRYTLITGAVVGGSANF